MSPPVSARPRLVDRYRDFLPIGPSTPVVTLGEGGTPLVHARRLGASLGLANLYLKVEGQNPTGSFKDRGMVVAVAKALETFTGTWEIVAVEPDGATKAARRLVFNKDGTYAAQDKDGKELWAGTFEIDPTATPKEPRPILPPWVWRATCTWRRREATWSKGRNLGRVK